ncbi:MAG: hypothetical protein Q9192_006863 [Flavoplaca navasiana]
MTSSAYLIHPTLHTSFLSPTALENLHYTTSIPIPSAKDIPLGHALVRMRAAAINPRDMMVIAMDTETYPVKKANGIAPCADGAGEIDTVGEGSRRKKGERVVEDSHLHRAPDYLSFAELAALPVAGGTAINTLLFGPVPLRKGMVVLTQGTGGVSCAVIQRSTKIKFYPQIATALGATVIVTSSSDEKLETAKRLGATHGINYRTNPSWEEAVIRLTKGKGVDHAVEIGGAQSIEKSVRATKQGGLISVVGILSEDRAVNLVGPVLFGAKIVRGVLGVSSAMVVKLLEVIQEQRIRPMIGREFQWKDAKDAFEYSIGRSGVGKIVIKVGD